MDKINFSVERVEFKSLLKEVMFEVLREWENQTTNENTLINVQEAAALLNLAVATVYEKTSQRVIPHYKHGKKLMFKKSELLAWVENRRIKSLSDLQREAHNITKGR